MYTSSNVWRKRAFAQITHRHAELQVSADGEAWSLPLRYSFYSPSHHVSSVWPRGGPSWSA